MKLYFYYLMKIWTRKFHAVLKQSFQSPLKWMYILLKLTNVFPLLVLNQGRFPNYPFLQCAIPLLILVFHCCLGKGIRLCVIKLKLSAKYQIVAQAFIFKNIFGSKQMKFALLGHEVTEKSISRLQVVHICNLHSAIWVHVIEHHTDHQNVTGYRNIQDVTFTLRILLSHTFLSIGRKRISEILFLVNFGKFLGMHLEN